MLTVLYYHRCINTVITEHYLVNLFSLFKKSHLLTILVFLSFQELVAEEEEKNWKGICIAFFVISTIVSMIIASIIFLTPGMCQAHCAYNHLIRNQQFQRLKVFYRLTVEEFLC